MVVRQVEVWEDQETPEAVRIEIAYKIRRTREQVTTTVKLNLGS
jgi:hypothetical protein